MDLEAQVVNLKNRVSAQEKEYSKAAAQAEILDEEVEGIKRKLAEKFEVQTAEDAKALLAELTAAVNSEMAELEKKLA